MTENLNHCRVVHVVLRHPCMLLREKVLLFRLLYPVFCDYMEDYKPFMSKGFVSIDDNTASKPIRILRDTGASQSLLLEGVLPLSENTSVGAIVLLQGVELGCFNVPRHQVRFDYWTCYCGCSS